MNIKENKYDDDVSFDKHKEVNRSVQRLEGAGEWSQLEQLFPDLEDKHVLDLGCGCGWHCIYAAQQRAASVHGVDISKKMPVVAEEKSRDYAITYQYSATEDLQFSKAPFDVAIGSLAFHYVKGFRRLAAAISVWLISRGSSVFPVEHPIFMAYGTQDRYCAENGEILHSPMDNYYYEGKREASFLGEGVVKHHRMSTAYLDTLLCSGFRPQHTIEPQSPEHMPNIEGMRDETRRPITLLITAIKRQP